ncbi:nickel insertion protein [Desulfovibrio sp. X2]|uniref:nickel insertion protein n=1 Tax=Desulfovibrio sp. X2 TaxID=941449 RepID=UPI001F3DC82B|nr:nickel insertion protein [Desulfovibrio sp. X2]
MQTRLFLDPRGGIAGDMLLAALAALGADLSRFQAMLARAGIAAGLALVPRMRGAVAGHGLSIECRGAEPLRHLEDLLGLAARLGLPPRAAARAEAAFRRLAEVEARVHGCSVHEVHFHEVGAVDTLVDVAGACWAVDELGIDEVVCAPLPWFTGTVRCAHGLLPLPAPAVLELLAGKPVYPTEVDEEIITPTGALLVDVLADRFARGPSGVIRAQATAYGEREIASAPWGLRALLLDDAFENAPEEAPSEEAGF